MKKQIDFKADQISDLKTDLKTELEPEIKIKLPEIKEDTITINQKSKKISKIKKWKKKFSKINYTFYLKTIIIITLLAIPYYLILKSKFCISYYVKIQTYLSNLYQENPIKTLFINILINLIVLFSFMPIYNPIQTILTIALGGDFWKALILLSITSTISLCIYHFSIRYIFKDLFLKKFEKIQIFKKMKEEMIKNPILTTLGLRFNFFGHSFSESVLALINVPIGFYMFTAIIMNYYILESVLLGVIIKDIQNYKFNLYEWKEFGNTQYGIFLCIIATLDSSSKLLFQGYFMQKLKPGLFHQPELDLKSGKNGKIEKIENEVQLKIENDTNLGN